MRTSSKLTTAATSWAAMAIIATAGTATAVGQDVESGPKAGEKVPALRVYGVVGAVEGQEADFVANRDGKPTVFVFLAAEETGIPRAGRPAARFLKTLDEAIGTVDNALIVAVWLGDNAFERHKDYLPRLQQSLQLGKTHLTVFRGPAAGPDGWGINTDAAVTAVVTHKDKVVRSFAFVSVNETDVRAVMTALKEAVKSTQ